METMLEPMIDFKLSEYAGRIGMAYYYQKDLEKAKRLELAALPLLRRKTRAIISRKQAILDELRAAKRGIKKMSLEGITFPLGEQRVKKLEQDLKAVRTELAAAGQATTNTLDCWQMFGATLYDLCNLCNRNYAQALKEIGPERLNERFSHLIFIYDLDYKDFSKRCWVDFDVDAPLTHAVLAYVQDPMINTETGRKAAQKALEECFPEIMENALRMVTDADGVRHLMNKDGEIVATLDEEGASI